MKRKWLMLGAMAALLVFPVFALAAQAAKAAFDELFGQVVAAR